MNRPFEPDSSLEYKRDVAISFSFRETFDDISMLQKHLVSQYGYKLSKKGINTINKHGWRVVPKHKAGALPEIMCP